MLEQYAAVQEQQRQTYKCCSNRVLLECCWVLLLLLYSIILVSRCDSPFFGCLYVPHVVCSSRPRVHCPLYTTVLIRRCNWLETYPALRIVDCWLQKLYCSGPEVQSNTMRVLLELSDRVLVTSWPTAALRAFPFVRATNGVCVPCLVLGTLEQSSDRRHVFLFRRNRIGNLPGASFF